ncbi:hypothetical protein OE88DRAFT_1644009 [Heliocybe sulcata]|uniref:Uncharacterized protein n=1 Tax=Heliocybe sulcata TaxID=5364 RepID=A0A5C3NFG7_9AGAM|nr:hypothetical protein OE88DRAFT_1644009 [Heliocybe sulcata]
MHPRPQNSARRRLYRAIDVLPAETEGCDISRRASRMRQRISQPPMASVLLRSLGCRIIHLNIRLKPALVCNTQNGCYVSSRSQIRNLQNRTMRLFFAKRLWLDPGVDVLRRMQIVLYPRCRLVHCLQLIGVNGHAEHSNTHGTSGILRLSVRCSFADRLDPGPKLNTLKVYSKSSPQRLITGVLLEDAVSPVLRRRSSRERCAVYYEVHTLCYVCSLAFGFGTGSSLVFNSDPNIHKSGTFGPGTFQVSTGGGGYPDRHHIHRRAPLSQ